VDDKLLSSLKEKFREYNKNLTRPYLPEKEIILKPLTNEELLEKLSDTKFISEFAEIIADSIRAIKESKFDANEIQKRLNDLSNFNTDQFIKFLNYLSKKYDEELNKNEQIDFHDMIHEATNLIDKGKFKPSWSFILVDEYQDISNSRNNLLKSLINATPNASLTVVGDDWQSIYRFTGAKLDLITKFEKQFGENTETILDISFRYNDSIARVAGKFIMMNVEQNKKIISTIKPSEKLKFLSCVAPIRSSNNQDSREIKNKDIKI
jgi:Superfamily I DNA and RNA helicases